MASFVQGLPVATPAEASAIVAEAIGPSATALAAPSTAAVQKPGSVLERWPVKTGQDDDVGKIAKKIVDTNASELGAFSRPDGWENLSANPPAELQKTRVAPAETTIWRIQATVIGLRMESDGDYHLELQDDSGAMIIAEVPLPDAEYIGEGNPFVDDIKAARDTVDQQFRNAVQSMEFVRSEVSGKLVPSTSVGEQDIGVQALTTLDLPSMTANPDSVEVFSTKLNPTKATITGVGFFDKYHGQVGNAPNIIELHPVLDIVFS